MTQIYKHILVLFMLLSLSMSSQNSVDKDPEILQNNINYHITQSEYDIENFNYYEAQKNR